MKAQMASSMGGRVAEAIVFGDISTGASSDIKHATEIARGMVTEYGMSEKLGPVFLGTEHEVFLGKQFSQQNSGFSEKVNEMIDSEVRELISSAYKRAEDILNTHIDQLHGLASLLIEREKLDDAEFEAFMNGRELPERAPAPEPEEEPEEEFEELPGEEDQAAETAPETASETQDDTEDASGSEEE